jgi:alpha-L-fucosidase 2
LTILTDVKVFNEFSIEGISERGITKEKSFKNILSRHLQDYQQKFDRVSFNLFSGLDPDDGARDAAELLEQARNNEPSLKLFELIFQMGRYVLLSSSRNKGLPANLQGIWSNGYSPAWNCRWQLDMNLQMCYWLANPANLQECNIPLFDFLENMDVAAMKRSKDLYDCRGISLPVAVDGTNVRYPTNSETQCIAAWLAQHFWEHYLFTLDKEFLVNRAYPYMKKAGEFFEDFLIQKDKGIYIILPSGSPENHPKDFPGRLSMNATIDLAVAKELFNNLIQASLVLNIDEQKRSIWQKMLAMFPSLPIGEDGALREWADDVTGNEAHRHFSHLYPLFPGFLMDLEEDPALVNSAVKAIKKREEAFLVDACGWSYAWLVALYARAGMAEEAYRNLMIFTKGFVTSDNFLSTISDLSGFGYGRTHHKNLIQVEAGLGITVAIIEMLLQSHNNLIRILPALPNSWEKGLIKGLKARGNFEISITWEGGYTRKVLIKSNSDSVCRIKFYREFYNEIKLRSNDIEEVELRKTSNNIFIFKAKTNTEYEFYSE